MPTKADHNRTHLFIVRSLPLVAVALHRGGASKLISQARRRGRACISPIRLGTSTNSGKSCRLTVRITEYVRPVNMSVLLCQAAGRRAVFKTGLHRGRIFQVDFERTETARPRYVPACSDLWLIESTPGWYTVY